MLKLRHAIFSAALTWMGVVSGPAASADAEYFFRYKGHVVSHVTDIENPSQPDQGGIPLIDVERVAAGYTHTCAVTTAREVLCWGGNGFGQLGDGTKSKRNTPVRVKGIGGDGFLSGVEQVTAGYDHTCAVMTDGEVACWGDNSYGGLGDGSTSQTSTPVRVKGVGGDGFLSGIKQVTGGFFYSCAIAISGEVMCWGKNGNGELGDGTKSPSSNPVRAKGIGGVGLLSKIESIAAGFGYTCAVTADKEALCWGRNFTGNLGDGTTSERSTPVKVKGVGGVGLLSGVEQIAAGGNHTCAVAGGEALCWGYNDRGQIGNGTESLDLSLAPVRVKGLAGVGFLSKVRNISVSDVNTCAVMIGGEAMCWGDAGAGMLGDGTLDSKNTPVRVKGVGGDGFLSGIKQIVVGGFHTCAATVDKQARCWGNNPHGQLGDGTTERIRFVPVRVMMTVNG